MSARIDNYIYPLVNPQGMSQLTQLNERGQVSDHIVTYHIRIEFDKSEIEFKPYSIEQAWLGNMPASQLAQNVLYQVKRSMEFEVDLTITVYDSDKRPLAVLYEYC